MKMTYIQTGTEKEIRAKLYEFAESLQGLTLFSTGLEMLTVYHQQFIGVKSGAYIICTGNLTHIAITIISKQTKVGYGCVLSGQPNHLIKTAVELMVNGIAGTDEVDIKNEIIMDVIHLVVRTFKECDYNYYPGLT
ncbi:hypothetical protein [Paenibacillus agricola]|uniref:Uncharacterized protein n=1 Tax=Paenibacillus agricola TaxID=2716264 RepID=A0ABX0JI76_9BACL|nr:hypothetical protein [Paenibacillus agricola]NHN35011.1 hypothetical protein [Paenibacillus agricola]